MSSIRRRLTLQLSIAIALLFIATGIGVSFTLKQRLYSRLDDELVSKAATVNAVAEVDDGEFEIDSSIQDFAGFRKGGDYFEARRIRDNNVLDRSTSGVEIGPIRPIGYNGSFFQNSTLDGNPARFFTSRYTQSVGDEKLEDDVYLVVGSPLTAINSQLALLTSILCFAGFLSIVATIFIVKAALARGLKPVGTLSGEIHGIRPENLEQRVSTNHLPSELLPIATTLNAWLDRLKASFDRERRFSSHAAHELRTPLAELRAMAESGAMFPEEATSSRMSEMVGVADELTALLDKLSLLSRADAGRQPVSHEAVRLSEIIRTTIDRNTDKAASRKLYAEFSGDAVVFESDPLLWTSIVQNLIGNAFSYAPEGSTVRIESEPNRFAVENPAPDLSETDLSQLFDRFWRKDKSRTGYGHSGLGLSIVQAAAKAMNGICRATLSSDRILRIEVVTDPRKETKPEP